jgi:hypothetical protein
VEENDWSASGQKVNLYLANGEIVVGWIVVQDPRRLLLALDREQENLRLVERHRIEAVDTDENREQWLTPRLGRERLAQLERFDQTVGPDIRRAIDVLDAQRLRRLALRYRELSALAHADRPLPGSDSQAVYAGLTATSELLDELERSSLLPVVQEHAGYLGSLVHEETLPGADGGWARGEQVHQLIADAQRDTRAVRELKPSLIVEAHEKAWSRKDTARWTDGMGDVVLGGGFAAANVTAGVIAGIFATLPTLGVGTVATTVGVVTSTYTGLTRLKSGLTTLIRGSDGSKREE